MPLRKSLITALAVVAILWMIFLVDALLPIDLRYFGIRPGTIGGLRGILFSPFLHAGSNHLAANTVPLFVLLTMSLAQNGTKTIGAVAIIMGLGGGLVWLFGSPETVHIGASGVIFGLIGFLLAGGIFRKDPVAMLLSIAVFFMYGGELLAGLIPRHGVSWSGHLFGFAAGIVSARLLAGPGKHRPNGNAPRLH